MTLLYDGSFEGILSVIFECYDRKIQPLRIIKESHYVPDMFIQTRLIRSDAQKSKRVLSGFSKRVSKAAVRKIYKAFHSELLDIELMIFDYMKLGFSSGKDMETDFRSEAVLGISKVNKMMDREIHRMHAFVRFQKTLDSIFAATIKPDFDVIPFIGDHFKKRYADQHWLIYDTKRNYGLYYNLQAMEVVKLNNPEWTANKKIRNVLLEKDEISFQRMWKNYFNATCISERKNMRLHLQHVPKRYWNHLPEKFLVSDHKHTC